MLDAASCTVRVYYLSHGSRSQNEGTWGFEISFPLLASKRVIRKARALILNNLWALVVMISTCSSMKLALSK